MSAGRESKGPPPFVVCKLWAKTSGKGDRYLTGRMAGARVLIMPNRDRNGDDDASHVLMLAEAGESAKKTGGNQ